MPSKTAVQADEPAVRELVEAERIHTYFQPIVSMMTKSVVGFEGLARGKGTDGSPIPPAMLFHPDLPPDLLVAVDRLCRRKSLERFRSLHEAHPDLLLFLNINPAILSHVEPQSSVLKDQVAEVGINPENIVLEVPAKAARSLLILEFADLYRELGFKAGLDNFATDDPFSQLIFALKPQFIKIGRSFYTQADGEHYSSKPLEQVIEAADKNGTIIIAQGVECEEESFRLMMNGIQLQQGFHYIKDDKDKSGDPLRKFFHRINETHERYKSAKTREVKRRKESFATMFKGANELLSKFKGRASSQFERICQTQVERIPGAISIFILDDSGLQITSRVHIDPPSGRQVSGGILGSEIGVDHSNADYVMHLDMGYPQFVTAPFTSPFNGEQACLITRPFQCSRGARHILCLEIQYPG